jgi:membrane protein implicated in regulation of membrane protease activity
MEVRVTDRSGIEQIVADCEQYWLATGVRRRVTSEMKAELSVHLHEALDAGKTMETVIGSDLPRFAESWAAEYRGPAAPDAWNEAERRRRTRKEIWSAWGWLTIVGVVIFILVLAGPKEDNMDDRELWRWIWVGAFVVLGIGEMVTAGLFMLPFAIGAGAAAILAWFEVEIWIQLLVFLVVSVAALWGIRRFAWRSGEPSHAVGAKRYVDAKATVIEDVDRVSGTGRVRLDTEQWRATTDVDGVIEAGTEVQVVDVRGARLVVEPRSMD